MDWGETSPLKYTILYVVTVAIILAVLFVYLGLVFENAESDDSPAWEEEDDSTSGGEALVISILLILIILTPIYVLFRYTDRLVDERIQQYHRRSSNLPEPSNVNESNITDVKGISQDVAEELFKNGYKSIEHMRLTSDKKVVSEAGIDLEKVREIQGKEPSVSPDGTAIPRNEIQGNESSVSPEETTIPGNKKELISFFYNSFPICTICIDSRIFVASTLELWTHLRQMTRRSRRKAVSSSVTRETSQLTVPLSQAEVTPARVLADYYIADNFPGRIWAVLHAKNQRCSAPRSDPMGLYGNPFKSVWRLQKI